ncbi:hypothetical protein JOF53_005431 [Crossiella equi]|uniref:Uncharacterized protein n=1 Tax=Crossiella equi TaxID=130796 RepID=A0ABS5AK23_9PSEU|nr:hypothetical protein [Crossiella equi]MBP2476559.1 hypothetical protein [Crossiella equi]
MAGVLHASEEELTLEHEVACETGELDARACRMDTGEVVGLPQNLQKQTEELVKNCRQLAECAQTGPQPRTGADIAKILRALTKASGNPAVQKLTGRADDFAAFAGRLSTVGGPLTSDSERLKEFAKASAYLVLSAVPPVGDLLGLAESVANGDVEQGVLAVLGVAATAVGLAFPPAGSAIAAAVAIYSLGKFLWNTYRAKARNWVSDPVGMFKYTMSSGVDVRWTEQKLGGRTVNVVFSRNKLIATQTLLMNSQWHTVAGVSKPSSRTLPTGPGIFYRVVGPLLTYGAVSAIVWQDGRAHAATCRVHPTVMCGGLTEEVTISENRNAVLELRYLLKDYDELQRVCPSPPCRIGTGKAFLLPESWTPAFAPYEVGVA